MTLMCLTKVYVAAFEIIERCIATSYDICAHYLTQRGGGGNAWPANKYVCNKTMLLSNLLVFHAYKICNMQFIFYSIIYFRLPCTYCLNLIIDDMTLMPLSCFIFAYLVIKISINSLQIYMETNRFVSDITHCAFYNLSIFNFL